jgi:DNA-binding GntR family transcriptional regulator
MRELRYLAIADELRRRIAAGEYPPGRLLPSESELATEHNVSRVTVRKALGHLKSEGIVDSRQGFGWYTVTTPLRQSLRDLTTIERQIRAAGREPSRELVRFAFIPTPARLTEILGTDSVLEIARVDRVDGQPFGTATVWVRGDLSAGLSRLTLEQRPLSEQLGVNLGGATQVISAVGASKQGTLNCCNSPKERHSSAASARPSTPTGGPSSAARPYTTPSSPSSSPNCHPPSKTQTPPVSGSCRARTMSQTGSLSRESRLADHPIAAKRLTAARASDRRKAGVGPPGRQDWNPRIAGRAPTATRCPRRQ